MENKYKFIQSDCIDGMENMSPGSVDIVVTSPPYNIGMKYKSYNDNLASDEYIAWSEKWLISIMRVLKKDGSLFLNLGASPSNQMMPHQIAMKFCEHLKLQNTFHWIKSISVETREGDVVTTGHFKPINSKRFVTDCHEYVFHFTKTGNVPLNRLSIGVPYKDKSNIGRWKHTSGSDKRCRGNTWFIPYKTIHRREIQRPHPATFPVQLAKNCILLHGIDEETTVLDPFVGLGNSAIAAFDVGVSSFTGFDIELDYLEYSKESIEELYDKKPDIDISLSKKASLYSAVVNF
jgi:site-specific DNA-methyltransferase (adenine-specific)